MPNRGNTDATFILCQLPEKYLGKHKPLYFAFVDLEKAFAPALRKVLWQAIKTVGVEEWLIHSVKGIYENNKTCVYLNGQFSNKFSITVGVHQGALLSPLLIIIAMEVLTRKFKVGCPWELLYAYN